MLYRSIVDAAKELEPEEALELLLVWADYALGDTDKINTDNKYIRLILSQVVPSLDAAERRYAAAVENGKKGAEFGKLGGRPRKNPSKTPVETPELSPVETPENVVGVSDEKTPEKPQTKPQDVDVDVSVDVSLDIINNNINNTKDTQVLPEGTNTIEENSPGEREQKCFTEKDIETIKDTYSKINVDKVIQQMKKCSSDDQLYNREVLDFIEDDEKYDILTSCLDYWNADGAEKFLDITNSLSWLDRLDVLTYMKVARVRGEELLVYA